MSVSRQRLRAADAIARTRELVEPALREAVDTLEDPRMRRVAAYQMGWHDADGARTPGGGKAIRPTLAILSAQAAGGRAADAVPAAVALELIHNFSLLHDDVVDNDVERRHRPTGWVVFGTGQAILAGTAMLTLAIEVLVSAGPVGQRCLPTLLAATQRMIGGQSHDLELEGRSDVTLDEVLEMEAGKTAALLSCAASIGAIATGASADVVAGLAAFGRHAGIAFQLVDDVLGVAGDPSVTGKSASSDVRSGKRSAPIVAAMRGGTDSAVRLAAMFAAAPPASDEDVATATALIHEAGGVSWASGEADARFAQALAELDRLTLPDAAAVADLAAVADYIVNRTR